MPHTIRPFLLLLLPLALATPANGSAGAPEGVPTDIAQEDAAPTHGSHRVWPDLPTHRQFMDDQVARLLRTHGVPDGKQGGTTPREKGAGTVRELTEIDTDGNGTIDTHVFYRRVFDSHGNLILFEKEWDYAPFGEMEGRHAETSTYDTHGNLIRYLIELHDPPAGRFHARFLTTTTYEEQARLPVRIIAETDYGADGTIEYREVTTFTADGQHHLVRMERDDGERPSVTTWEYDQNGNVSVMRVEHFYERYYGPLEGWVYTYDDRHRVVKTVHQSGNPWGAEYIFSTTLEFNEHDQVVRSVASHDFDDEGGILERVATTNEYDQHRNLVRAFVLVTDNGHADEFRHQTTTIIEYDERERMTRRVADTIVDPHTYDYRIIDTFSYEGADVRVVTEKDLRIDGSVESRTFAASTLDPPGRVVRSLVEEDRNADGRLDFRIIRSFEFHGNLPPGAPVAAAGRSSSPETPGLRVASSNPFRTGIALSLTLDQRGPAELRIYDTAGRRVRTLIVVDSLALINEKATSPRSRSRRQDSQGASSARESSRARTKSGSTRMSGSARSTESRNLR